jgi:hypothetical protein
LQGEIKHKLTVIDAIKAGFITENKLTPAKIKEFLQPVNSLLKNQALVTYSELENAFLFEPVIKIEPQNMEVQYVYGLATTETEFIQIVHTQMQLLNVVLKTAKLSIFSHTTETNFIVLNFKKSILSMQTAHVFFSEFVHALGLSEDKEDLHSFVLVIPVATVIKSAAEYRYITKAISYELLSAIDSQTTEYALTSNHGNSTYRIIHSKPELPLLDISEEQIKFASNSTLERKDVFKKLTPKQLESEEEDLQIERNNLVEILNLVSNKWMLLFTHMIKYKLIHKDMDYTKDIIDNINLMLNDSLSSEDIQKHLLEPISRIHAN